MNLRCLPFVLLLAATTAPALADDCDWLAAEVLATYDFQPRDLSSSQKDEKGALMDAFWARVKASRESCIPPLRQALSDGVGASFFAFDGSMLLLRLSSTPADRELVANALARVDVIDVQLDSFVNVVRALGHNGFDVTAASFRVLETPTARAFIPAHSMFIGQDFALVLMLFSMEEERFVPGLIERLQTHTDDQTLLSIVLALHLANTAEADAALARFAADPSRPAKPRDDAKARRTDKGHLDAKYVGVAETEIRGARRAAIARGISDEALDEFLDISANLRARRSGTTQATPEPTPPKRPTP